jgi:hypothetical protein
VIASSAIGDRCGYGFLISLGGCHHLDGLEQRKSLARVGDYSWPSPGDCEGSCVFHNGALKSKFSGLLVSLRYFTCG